jgi:D-sedoheptulose 7-phosphate isomerase
MTQTPENSGRDRATHPDLAPSATSPHSSGQTAEGHIRKYLLENSEAARQTAETCAEPIADAARRIVACLRRGGKLLICGNGGSAAQSQHMAAELVGALQRHVRRPALPAMALTTDTSILTAVSNDFGFAEVFERQIDAIGSPGDLLLAISTSGDSENVVRAVRMARRKQMQTIALTGPAPGRLAGEADLVIGVPEQNIQHLQEIHLAVGHLLCILSEDAICGGGQL